jgi:hypothetical protein
MKFVLPAVCLAVLLAAQTYKSKELPLPREVAPQPIPFSHRVHAAASCLDCHTTAAKADRATIPQGDRCLLCHRGMKNSESVLGAVKAFLDQNQRIPWVRVYRVPEYVFFSHAKHVGAKLECAVCHGPVVTRDVLSQERSTSMTTCMNCHAQKSVSNECGFCHTLGY